MIDRFESIYSRILGTGPDESGYGGIKITGQFKPATEGPADIARNLNAAFLIALCGPSHPDYRKTEDYLKGMIQNPEWGDTALFYWEGLSAIREEIREAAAQSDDFRDTLDMAYRHCLSHRESSLSPETRRSLWSLFFPEGVYAEEKRQDKIAEIRAKRKVTVTTPNPAPLTHPARELLFTSNVLLTLPQNPADAERLPYSKDFIAKLKSACNERQHYWYDNPIQIGVAKEANLAVHGLRSLNRMMAQEKERRNAGPDDRLRCLLSVSVTHKGLHAIAQNYLEEEFASIESLPHLEVYLFSEITTRRLLEEFLIPVAQTYLRAEDIGLLKEIISVDGEYGRHYSFLKAIAAFWNVFIDNTLKATFKVDLDRSFPQEELIRQTGKSALDHLKTSLWGSEGHDQDNENVELGMIAGGVVNPEDAPKSVYTPNIKYPEDVKGGQGIFFFSRLPMALSTEAEICMPYPSDGIDGTASCAQRVHVIGGMNGILVSALRKYRPFTPTFIGRAEDQAYLMSVLFRHIKSDLRVLHAAGLMMVQDHFPQLEEAQKAGETGRQIGDLVRILYFSFYARALNWPLDETKAYLAPFTGCFVSRIPVTITYSRLAMALAEKFGRNESTQALSMQHQAVYRLHRTVKYLQARPNPLVDQLDKEKKAWDLFYNILDAFELNLKNRDFFALKLARRAENFLMECRLAIGKD